MYARAVHSDLEKVTLLVLFTTINPSMVTIVKFWISATIALLLAAFLGPVNGLEVRLSLNGAEYSNNSVVDINSIGANSANPSTEALQCNTDLRPCCRMPFQVESLKGEWYYPNRTRVHGAEFTGLPFFRTRGENNGTVNLFRLNTDIMDPVGRYCCEIPNTSGVNQTLCVGIVPPNFIELSASGSSRVGQSYTLICDVPGGSVTGYQWRNDGTILSAERGPNLSFAALGPNDAGGYTCEATVDGIVYKKDANVAVLLDGVYLTLRGMVYANNSVIIVSDISTDSNNPTGNALQCITNLRPCCRQEGTPQMLKGEWYFPDGTQVHGAEVPGTGFFRTRGSNDGTINMFRTDDRVLSPVGLYCCEIPDSNGVNTTLCADIIPPDVFVVIKDGGTTPTAGLSYFLTCSVVGAVATTYQWRKDGTVLSETAATLSFSPLEIANAGRYTCEASVDSTVYRSIYKDIIIQTAAPPINVQATQSSSSAPVEVSWSPPSGGAAIITRFKIFYGNGESTYVDSVVTAVSLTLSGNYVGQMVSIQTEISSLSSEVISATVTGTPDSKEETTRQPCVFVVSNSCTNEIGISVGVVLLIAIIVVVVIITICMVMICWQRKSSSSKGAELQDFVLSSTSVGGGVLYEDPDSLVQNMGRGNYQLTQCPAYGTSQSATKSDGAKQPPLPIVKDQQLLYEN